MVCFVDNYDDLCINHIKTDISKKYHMLLTCICFFQYIIVDELYDTLLWNNALIIELKTVQLKYDEYWNITTTKLPQQQFPSS